MWHSIWYVSMARYPFPCIIRESSKVRCNESVLNVHPSGRGSTAAAGSNEAGRKSQAGRQCSKRREVRCAVAEW